MSIFKRKPKATAATILAEQLATVSDQWEGNVRVSRDGQIARLELTISAHVLADVVRATYERLL